MRGRVRRFFDAVAFAYDPVVGRAMQGKVARAVALLGPLRWARCLDVCTGTGLVAWEMARRGARVTAVDFSPGMLSRARRKGRKRLGTVAARGATAGEVEFVRMDATALEFADKSFDICTISMALHEMPEEARVGALREAARVARRHVLVVDYAGPPANPLTRAFCAVAEWLEGGWYRDFLRGDVEELFRRAGLEVVVRARSDFVGMWLAAPR